MKVYLLEIHKARHETWEWDRYKGRPGFTQCHWVYVSLGVTEVVYRCTPVLYCTHVQSLGVTEVVGNRFISSSFHSSVSGADPGAGNDCHYRTRAPESVFKSEKTASARLCLNQSWCERKQQKRRDPVIVVTMTGLRIMGHALTLYHGKHKPGFLKLNPSSVSSFDIEYGC